MRATFKTSYDERKPDTVEDTDEVRLNCDVEHWETDATVDNRGVPLPTGPTTVAHRSASVLGRGLSLVELLGRAAEREEEEELAAASAHKPWQRAALEKSSRAVLAAPVSVANLSAAAATAAAAHSARKVTSSGRKRTARPSAVADSFVLTADTRKRARD